MKPVRTQGIDVCPYRDSSSKWLLSAFRILMHLELYFFAEKAEFYPFQNSPKNLDLSYKTDLGLWDCLGSVKLIL